MNKKLPIFTGKTPTFCKAWVCGGFLKNQPMKLIKITFRIPQKMVQDGLEAEGMFIICDRVRFFKLSIVVYVGDEINFFPVNEIHSIEPA